MRVAIVSPSVALRLGLRELINSLPGMEVVAESDLSLDSPEVEMLVLTSLEDLPLPSASTRPVLLLTDAPEVAAQLVGIPVWGILPLDASPEEIQAALIALGEGLWVGSPALVANLLERHPAPALGEGEEVIDPLTGRELEVLQLAAQGKPNKQIALDSISANIPSNSTCPRCMPSWG
jgi:DNA-binding NarL/FixJ family response regulator